MEPKKPIAVIDLETTGVDIAHDKIIELGISYWGKSDRCLMRFNPGREISEGAFAVHGITLDELRDKPTFEERAQEIYSMFDGCDLGGFNIEAFDLPMIVEEFLRYGYEFPLPGTNVFDAIKIYKKMEPRDLTAAYKYYCGKTINEDEKHGAGYDADVTTEVLMGQMRKYFGTFDELLAASKYEGELEIVDFAKKLALREDGEIVYNIGKGKGNTIQEDLGFGNWLLRQDWLTKDTRRKLKQAMEEQK